MSTLVIYFSQTGTTRAAAENVKLKKIYPKAKWHKPLNANGITEEEIKNWM